MREVSKHGADALRYLDKHPEKFFSEARVGADTAQAIEQNERQFRASGVKLSPLMEAERLLKADSEHRSLAADQALMLNMVMPFVNTGLRQLASGISQWNAHQGFWPPGLPTAAEKSSKIALIHTELSEMLEAVRKGDRHNEAEEAADILIRLLDYCGHYGIDLGEALQFKQLNNYSRPFRHGKEI